MAAVARKSISKSGAKAPLPVLILIASFLCPTEFSVYVADLRIPPHRAALILLLPFALWRLCAQKEMKVRSFDIAFALFNAWTVAIFTYHHGQPDGLVYGTSLAIDGCGSYLVARVWVRDHATMLATLRAVGYAILVAAAIALPETLFGRNFTHDLLREITGYIHPTAVESRLGLTRAYGSFDHPIHYGTFCAAMLAVYWYAARSTGERVKRFAFIGIATFLGLSSAPILCLLLQTAMLIWERATRGTTNRTSMTLIAMTGLYVGAACIMTRSPINFIATGMTLDSWTGYYRLQIWENGLLSVYANPWTGIGLNEWERPWWMVSSTVDAFWLVIAMREGMPGLTFLVAGIALLSRAVYQRGLSHPDLACRRLARGWFMSLIALMLIGTTVHFWNVLYSFFFFFVGLAGWLADPARRLATVKAAYDRRARHHRRNTNNGYPACEPSHEQPDWAAGTPSAHA